MSTKNDIVTLAYEQLRISGITSGPTPTDEALALSRLESMMAQFFGGKNMDVGYNFETTPNLNSQTNVPLAHESMMFNNLAVRLIPAFNKPVPMELKGEAKSSFSSSLAIVKSQQIQPVQPSRRMPRGSGNTFREEFTGRFQRPVELPPVSAANEELYVGETNDYFEDFSAWLGSNTISSYTIAVDPRLTVDSDSNTTTRVLYTLTANTNATDGIWQYVKITVTDSAARVNIRLINFLVVKPPTVP